MDSLLIVEQPTKPFTKDLRRLEISEVCEFGEWLRRYVRLENPDLTDSKQLLKVLIRNSREFEGDLGVFGVEE